jgi:C-terminal processing protease CtpA/Prc
VKLQQYLAIFGTTMLIPTMDIPSMGDINRVSTNATIRQAKNNSSKLIDEVWQIIDQDYLFDSTQDRTKWQTIRSQYTQTRPRTTEELHETIRAMLKTLHDRFTVFLDPIEFRPSKPGFYPKTRSSKSTAKAP